MQKRSLVIAGHSTSMALEPEFWAALDRIASERNISISQLVTEIDEAREGNNLSSAVRVSVLNWLSAPHSRT